MSIVCRCECRQNRCQIIAETLEIRCVVMLRRNYQFENSFVATSSFRVCEETEEECSEFECLRMADCCSWRPRIAHQSPTSGCMQLRLDCCWAKPFDMNRMQLCTARSAHQDRLLQRNARAPQTDSMQMPLWLSWTQPTRDEAVCGGYQLRFTWAMLAHISRILASQFSQLDRQLCECMLFDWYNPTVIAESLAKQSIGYMGGKVATIFMCGDRILHAYIMPSNHTSPYEHMM